MAHSRGAVATPQAGIDALQRLGAAATVAGAVHDEP